MRVCRAADNRFVGCKITKKFVHEQAFAHRKYLIVEALRGIYLCIVMKTSNAKNLRREVKRQLKELRGRVGQMAVGELKIENGELKIKSCDFDDSICSEAKAERNEDSFISPLSSFNSPKHPTLPELEQFIRRDHELRYNVLTEQTECRRKDDAQGEFSPVTQRVYRTWLTDLQRAGVDFWKVDGLRTAIESMHIEDYHPVANYFRSLPEWDGMDRMAPLMRRLTHDEVMVGYLCRWLLAFVAQAQGREGAVYANSVAPILISEQQGWHKSTFCRLLLPPELRAFYTDNFNLTAESQCEHRLTDCLLINLDEYDRYSARKQSTLKNLMQMPSLRMRKAYARNATTLPRIASFIGTSNTPYLLTDTTGSRRFLCVELTEMIDVDTPIEYKQLYAQCMCLLEKGVRHHFTAEEVADIELRNRVYRHIPPVEEHCKKHFRQPRGGEKPQLFLAAEIYEYLRQRNPRLMRGVNEQNFGALLREWGFKRREHNRRRVYEVVQSGN